jgi:hypothetical protein
MDDSAAAPAASPAQGTSRGLIRGIFWYVATTIVFAAGVVTPLAESDCWGCGSPLRYVPSALWWAARWGPLVAPVVAFVFGAVRRRKSVILEACLGGAIANIAFLYGTATTTINPIDFGPMFEMQLVGPANFVHWLLAAPWVEYGGQIRGPAPLGWLIVATVATTVAAAVGFVVGQAVVARRRPTGHAGTECDSMRGEQGEAR